MDVRQQAPEESSWLEYRFGWIDARQSVVAVHYVRAFCVGWCLCWWLSLLVLYMSVVGFLDWCFHWWLVFVSFICLSLFPWCICVFLYVFCTYHLLIAVSERNVDSSKKLSLVSTTSLLTSDYREHARVLVYSLPVAPVV